MKFKFVLIFLILAVTLSTIGYYGQTTLSELIDSVQEESKPNYRLNLIQDISSSLLIGENSLNRFSVTKLPHDLDNYRAMTATIGAKLDSFNSLSITNRKNLQEAQQLNDLIKEKVMIANRLIKLKDQENTSIATNRILHAIKKQEQRLAEESLKIESREIGSIELPTLLDTPLSDLSKEPEEKKPGLFKKLLGRKKKSDESEEATKGPSITWYDTTAVVNPVFDYQKPIETDEIKNLVTRIGEEEKEFNKRLSNKELDLLISDKEVSERLNRLIGSIESQEQIISDQRAQRAAELTAQTREIMSRTIIISLVTICFLLGVIFVDFSRLKKKRAQLKIAKEEAERLARIKQDFLATMSHEIRTPLTAIVGFTEQLKTVKEQEKIDEYTEIIRKSSHHLLNLVNDILDYARLEAGSVKSHSVAFHPQQEIEEVMGLFQAQAKEKNILLVNQSNVNDLVLMGDSFRYKQILINLVSNGLKFTESGAVTVKAQYQNAQLVTSITDTGVGIPKSHVARIFKEFEQADTSTTRNYGGTGLGLTIVNKLIELLEGTIEVESEPEVGTTFTISLPFEESNKEVVITPVMDIETVDLSGLKICIVDDEPFNLELQRTILEQHQAEVTMVQDPELTFEIMAHQEFDMIILDLHMPKVSGFELAQKIRLNENSSVRLLASTASTTPEDFQGIEEAGFDDWITKPFTTEELVTKISNLVNPKGPGSSPKLRSFDSLEIDGLINLSQGNMGFVVNMLKLYLDGTEDNFRHLATALELADLEGIRLTAHKMVAPSRHFNLKYFTTALKQIETEAANSGNLDKIKSSFEEAKQMWLRIRPVLKMKIEEAEQQAVVV